MDGESDSPAVSPNATSSVRSPSTITRRKHYSIKMKREAVAAASVSSCRAAARKLGVCKWTLTAWIKSEEDIGSFEGSEKTLARTTGRKEIVTFSDELIVFMKDLRRDDHALTTTKMVEYIREEHNPWFVEYMAHKKEDYCAYESLMRLLRRFAYRHGFVQKTAHGLKMNMSYSDMFCQCLNVGVMGPLKRKLRTDWLKEKVRATTAKESV